MKPAILLLVTVFLVPTSAWAETSGWLKGREALKFGRMQDRAGKTITKMECRDTDRIGLNVAAFDYRVTFKEMKDETEWMWAVGSEYGRYEAIAKREGFKRVSFHSFTRKRTGLKVRCGVWHKKL